MRSVFAMASLGQGEVSIARAYGVKPSAVFRAVVEQAQIEKHEALEEGKRIGARSLLPKWRAAS